MMMGLHSSRSIGNQVTTPKAQEHGRLGDVPSGGICGNRDNANNVDSDESSINHWMNQHSTLFAVHLLHPRQETVETRKETREIEIEPLSGLAQDQPEFVREIVLASRRDQISNLKPQTSTLKSQISSRQILSYSTFTTSLKHSVKQLLVYSDLHPISYAV